MVKNLSAELDEKQTVLYYIWWLLSGSLCLNKMVIFHPHIDRSAIAVYLGWEYIPVCYPNSV